MQSTTIDGDTGTYEYDAHGNIVKMPHLPEMFWDFRDNLKEVSLDLAGNKAYYTYDANGNKAICVLDEAHKTIQK